MTTSSFLQLYACIYIYLGMCVHSYLHICWSGNGKLILLVLRFVVYPPTKGIIACGLSKRIPNDRSPKNQ